VTLVTPDPLDRQDRGVQTETVDQVATTESPDLQDHQDPRADVDPTVRMVAPAIQDQKDPQVHQDHRASQCTRMPCRDGLDQAPRAIPTRLMLARK